MRKRMIRGLIFGAAGMIVLSLGSAQAAVSVSIDNAAGSTVYSLPTLPDGVSYPDGFNTKVTGTSTFDTDGSVLFQISSDTIDNNTLVNFSGQADATCAAGSCTWSFRVPFVLAPGSYHVQVTAAQPDPNNPELQQTAVDTVDLQII